MPELGQSQRPVPKILLYGKAGSGKTSFVTTAGSTLYYLDLDNNFGSALSIKDQFTESRSKVWHEPVYDTTPTVPTQAARLRSKLAEIAELCAAGKFTYKIVALDNLTRAGEACLAAVRYNLNPRYLTSASAPLQIQHWGEAMNQLDNILTLLKSLPVPVVVIAHDDNINNSYMNLCRPLIIGEKLSPKLNNLFSEIWFTEILYNTNNLTFNIKTTPSPVYTTRSNSGLSDFNANVGLLAMLERVGWKV